jgi:hypothetical protein
MVKKLYFAMYALFMVSERFDRSVVDYHRSTHCYRGKAGNLEDAKVRSRHWWISAEYIRCGLRMACLTIWREGWTVNHKPG